LSDKTATRYEEQKLASEWNFKFKDAMINKAPYTKRWSTYQDAYNGDYFKSKNLPEYKSNLVSNYIFSIIETIRPIMLDNNPKFQSMPRQPEGLAFSNDLQEALMYEWDRENMSQKLYKELVNTLVFGTSIFFLPWDSNEKCVHAIPVNPFNVFPDPLATSIEDAEYIIYASYKNVSQLKRFFPDKTDLLSGGNINYSELVQDKDRNARIDNQVLVLEVWTRNYETDEKVKGDEKHYVYKYPNGRVITLCPELGIVLNDKPNPYKDGSFPFVLIKDYDLPDKFWGEGEVTQLLSPQKHMNDLNNAVIDSAKATANMPWIIDKNSGIGYGKITARPGLVIRKNPGSEVRRDQPPSMPLYVVNAIETYKSDIEQISGIYNTLKGDSATGVYTAQGILALQEAGQVRIRLKVKLLEDSLGKVAELWFSRMKQFWKDDKWLRITKQDGSYDLKMFTKTILEYDYDIKITAGSTMPVNRGAMLDLMVRLAQTPMPDGQPLVDREAVVNYLPEEVKSSLLRRMSGKQDNLDEIKKVIEQLGQQLQAITQESQQNDEQTFDVLDDITSSIEAVNKQILQLKAEHDKIESERQAQDKQDQIKKEAYNKGFGDAESMYSEDVRPATEKPSGESQSSPTPTDVEGSPEESLESLPDDILSGIENMTDEELDLLLQQNPELIDLIK